MCIRYGVPQRVVDVELVLLFSAHLIYTASGWQLSTKLLRWRKTISWLSNSLCDFFCVYPVSCVTNIIYINVSKILLPAHVSNICCVIYTLPSASQIYLAATRSRTISPRSHWWVNNQPDLGFKCEYEDEMMCMCEFRATYIYYIIVRQAIHIFKRLPPRTLYHAVCDGLVIIRLSWCAFARKLRSPALPRMMRFVTHELNIPRWRARD